MVREEVITSKINDKITAAQDYCPKLFYKENKTSEEVLDSKNNKKPRRESQSQAMVWASQLEILPCIYSRLFHIQYKRQHTKIGLARRRNSFSFSSYTGCSNHTSSGIQPPSLNMYCRRQVILTLCLITFKIRQTETLLWLIREKKVSWLTFPPSTFGNIH